MRKLNFVKISPTQNMTVLVTDPVDPKDYISIAEKIMSYDSIYAEQVGYITKSVNKLARMRLNMMGGEFCGNATLALASYIVWKDNKTPVGKEQDVVLEVSGADELLNCKVQVREDFFIARVKMPYPKAIEELNIIVNGKEYEIIKVKLPGINHYIVDVNLINDKIIFAEEAIKIIDSTDDEDAFGIMFWEKDTNYITPLVYVKQTNSLVWERGCATGSTALGVYLYHKNNLDYDSTNITQPGGIITVYNSSSGDVTIEGVVKIVAEGAVFIK